MSTRSVVIGLGGVAGLAVFAWWLLPSGEQAPAPPPQPVVERTRNRLELRDDRLYEPGAAKPFAGLLVEFHPGGQRKVAIEINDGKPNGLSRGWYRNGQLEVEEHFAEGVAQGLRTRWYENGRKRSEAHIRDGAITGLFTQWHDNGEKAAEATIVDGMPAGVCLGWHRSGAPKSRVELRGGEIVSREYWEDIQGEPRFHRVGGDGGFHR